MRRMMAPHGPGSRTMGSGGTGGGGSAGGGEPQTGSMRHSGGVGMLINNSGKFSLTKAQVDNLNGMKMEFQMEKVDLQAAAHKAKIRLRAAMQNPKAKEKAVMAAIDAVAQAEAEMKKMRYRHLTAARKVLKAPQMNKVMTHCCEMEHTHQTAS